LAPMTRHLLVLQLLGLVVVSVSARANEIPCAPAEAGAVMLDGLLGDWKDVQGVGVDAAGQVIRGVKEWSGPDDLSFDVFCNHDATHLYLAVNVRDDYFVRTPKARGDDHLVVLLGTKRLVVVPGNLRNLRGKMTWGARGRVKGVRMAEALQQQGYSVELQIPLKLVPGYRPGGPAVPGAVWVADCDSKAKGTVQTIIGTARSARVGRFAFAQARAELSGFLRDKGYGPGDIRAKHNANVVGDKRVEQVVLAGRTIGIIGEGLPGGSYFYLDLPVRQPRDVYWLKLMDLNGDGRTEIVTRYVERTGNGRRELIAVFRFNDADKFVRSFAHEILKGQKDRLITNRFTVKRRRRTRRSPGGVDLIFDRPQARGFTKESFRELPSADCHSIILPWSEEKRRRFVFEGEEYSQH
jgi:hypothetical protein